MKVFEAKERQGRYLREMPPRLSTAADSSAAAGLGSEGRRGGSLFHPRPFEQLGDFDVAPLYLAIARIALARSSSSSASALHNPALGTQKEERKTSLR